MKQPIVYIVTNHANKVLYTGVTAYLKERLYQHREELIKGFSKKYHCTKLVYIEFCTDMEQAILREKQIKGWVRAKKIALIESLNPDWNDMYEIINA